MSGIPWQKVVEQAEHYIAIYQHEIYLYDQPSYPWEFVSRLDRHDYHKLDGNNSITVYADHPRGITFRWNVEVVHFNDHPQRVDIVYLSDIIAYLPEFLQDEFKQHLLDTVLEATIELTKQMSYVTETAGYIRTLEMLANTTPTRRD